MHFRKVVCRQALLGLVALFPMVIGCGPRIEPQPLSPGEARIRKFGLIYQEYMGSQHKRPASIDELKTWSKKLSKTRLTELEIPDVEEVFVSPRDQHPYVLVRGGPTGTWQVVAHEKVGEGGKRYLFTAMGSFPELEEAAFKQVVPNAR